MLVPVVRAVVRTVGYRGGLNASSFALVSPGPRSGERRRNDRRTAGSFRRRGFRESRRGFGGASALVAGPRVGARLSRYASSCRAGDQLSARRTSHKAPVNQLLLHNRHPLCSRCCTTNLRFAAFPFQRLAVMQQVLKYDPWFCSNSCTTVPQTVAQHLLHKRGIEFSALCTTVSGCAGHPAQRGTDMQELLRNGWRYCRTC